MGKFNKDGGVNSGGKNRNRSGGSGYSGPGHGQNHTKDNNHRMRTQKNQGRRQGGGNRYGFGEFNPYYELIEEIFVSSFFLEFACFYCFFYYVISIMRIYIRTPLVNKSKMVPHLVEHCTGHSALNLDDFFDLSYGADGVINTDYTYFEFDKWINYKDAIKRLTKEINKESFLYEKKIIKQELEDVNYDQRIYEGVVKKFIDLDLSVNKFEKVSREDVKRYHEKYYTLENMVVVDEFDYKILKQGFKVDKVKNQNQIIKKFPFIFEDDKYLVYIGKKTEGTGYWEMYFFFRMLCFYGAYAQRWQNGEYYYLEPYFYEYDDNCIVMIGDYDYSQLDEKFFEGGKKYIINMFEAGYFKEKFFLNEYFYGIPKTRKEAIQICKNFTREEFKEFLELK